MNLVSLVKKYNILILIFVLYIVLSAILIYSSKFEKTISVSEKYIRASKSNPFRVVDDKNNTYIVTDSVYFLEFNSSDDYGLVQVGKTYKVYGYWFRLPFMSWFPMIYKFEPV